MNASEVATLKEHIRAALLAVDYPPPALPRFDDRIVERALDRIVSDTRLGALFWHLRDRDAVRRTFLSVYFRVQNTAPVNDVATTVRASARGASPREAVSLRRG